MINQIEQHSIDKICANQSISNISVLIKELVDNSLDAKSNIITIDIDVSGLNYIELTDNGTGIDEQYFNNLCNRGTTSKLSNFNDIFNIKTMGLKSFLNNVQNSASPVCRFGSYIFGCTLHTCSSLYLI